MAPFFSIILPVYKVKNYLHRCVDSILRQGFTDYEIILVNDGSTDGSGWLCDEIAAKYPCVGVIHKKNGGLASARNAGMEIASGEYIWFVDSDDWIEERSLGQIHKALTEHTPDVLKCNYVRVTDQETPVYSNVEPGVYTGEALEPLFDKMFTSGGKFMLSACTHIYRQSFLQERRAEFISEREVGSEDYLFNLQILVHAKKICVLSEPLYYYEQRNGSLTQCRKADLPQRYAVLRRLLEESYRSDEIWEQYAQRVNTFYVWHLLRGTCIPNAYSLTQGHTLREGRKEVRRLLKDESCCAAVKNCDVRYFTKKQKQLLKAMEWKLEWLFYWLYVKKPRNKKVTVHENAD